MIYFSGHGHYDEFYGDAYWIPVDAKYEDNRDYFSYKDIVGALGKIPSQHSFIIVDSCYSGAVLVENTRNSLSQDPREKDPSRWILASGRNQVVPDGVKGGHSPFAEQLLDTLERYADEGISVLSLVDKVTKATIHNGKQQPIGRPLQNTGDKGGQFVFYPKTFVPDSLGPPQVDSTKPSSDTITKSIVSTSRFKKLIFPLLYIVLGSLLITHLLSPREGVPLVADLEVDQINFEYISGNFGLDDIPLSGLGLTDYQEINLGSASLRAEELGGSSIDLNSDGKEMEIRAIEGIEKLNCNLYGASSLSITSLQPDSGAKVKLHINQGLQTNSPELFLDIKQSQAFIGEISYRGNIKLDLSWAEIWNKDLEMVVHEIEDSGQLNSGGKLDKIQRITYAMFPEFGIQYKPKSLEDAAYIDLNAIKVYQPEFYRLSKDVGQLESESSLINGKITFGEKISSDLKTLEFTEGEKLRFEGGNPWTIDPLKLTDSSIKLSLRGKASEVWADQGDESTLLNPNNFDWYWHTQKVLILLLTLLFVGLGFLLPKQVRRKFKKMIGR